MERASLVTKILTEVKNETDDILKEPNLVDLTAEEVVVLATEITTSRKISKEVSYSSPVATIDRKQVRFYLGDGIAPNISGEDYDDTDYLP